MGTSPCSCSSLAPDGQIADNDKDAAADVVGDFRFGAPYFNKSRVFEIRADIRTPYFNFALLTALLRDRKGSSRADFSTYIAFRGKAARKLGDSSFSLSAFRLVKQHVREDDLSASSQRPQDECYISQEMCTRAPFFVTTAELNSFQAIAVDGADDGRWSDLSRSFSVKAQKSPRRIGGRLSEPRSR